MTKTATGPSENPDSTDELVRDLEESGYPVDGATEQFVPQPDGLSVERWAWIHSGTTRHRARKIHYPN
jgi:hypothetical protein